ncbi:hypothetical protein B0H67DRAFT_577311 [Lasiosphaeris hirsuta]|uniref:Uncharacterized protein n=1 Tax=Lasiosphaeris hirsuta TaxID=260670 RepID=A0AA40DYW2_9PEZI|nr:hypothetical protein B0H67DRAFT_577311 [Lasiosphaeris hirsuta]
MAALFIVDVAVNPGAEVEAMCLRFLVKKRFVDEAVLSGVRQGLDVDQAIVYGSENGFVAEGMASRL